MIGQRVSTVGAGVPNVGRGIGVVATRSPKHEDRNRPAALAAERFMNVRRVSRLGYTGRESIDRVAASYGRGYAQLKEDRDWRRARTRSWAA